MKTSACLGPTLHSVQADAGDLFKNNTNLDCGGDGCHQALGVYTRRSVFTVFDDVIVNVRG